MSNTIPAPTDRTCEPDGSHPIGIDAATVVASRLKALSDPLRLRMLSAIVSDPRGEACVCDLAKLGDVSQPTISHHLKVLKDTGLLTSERRSTWVYYRLQPTQEAAVRALLESFAPAAVLAAEAPEEHECSHTPAEPVENLDERVTHLADELAAEHAVISRDLVVTVVRESYASLARSAKVTRHLIPLTERFARQRLTDLTRDHENGIPQVLFVCVQNAGRSHLAAALVNQLSSGKVLARSAGSTPATDVHPRIQSLLTEIEGDQAQERFPKPLTDDAVRAADVVVTMGCGDVCPVIPGVRYEDWAVGDPALASAEELEAIRDDIAARVRTLLDTLTSH
jgi:ArsR family transcriptional regulator